MGFYLFIPVGVLTYLAMKIVIISIQLDYFLILFLWSFVHLRNVAMLSVIECSVLMALSLFIFANNALKFGVANFSTWTGELITEFTELSEPELFSLNKMGDLGSFRVISTESDSLPSS